MTFIACETQFPDLFDAVYKVEALPVLKICATCEYQVECLKRVNPAENYYDGIAGGYVWRNGKPKLWSIRDRKHLVAYRTWLASRKVSA